MMKRNPNISIIVFDYETEEIKYCSSVPLSMVHLQCQEGEDWIETNCVPEPEEREEIEISQEEINKDRWIYVRTYRDYLLQFSDGLAASLVLRKFAGEDNQPLANDIVALNNYKQTLRDIPQNYSDPTEVVFPDPVLGLSPRRFGGL